MADPRKTITKTPERPCRYKISKLPKRPLEFDPDYESAAVVRALRRTNPALVRLLGWLDEN